ncbi:TetR/AcrR family transcriptional regulator [Nocardia beijingensis]|uniref:TetR/AcrR family transcriptional regulator n=1 Tax=Nocardia beijingensis TaxID=95162 RepID=A0ABW7WI42_9NOCA|nr:TetR/AcrR family transcriptional regulator C-terminal domain-containing protein [Nocardia beijingensis]MBF6074640.1 TetR/AcrR family transcriptional regulator C-terminal domain-containing protein [Nocardia beijingensis]
MSAAAVSRRARPAKAPLSREVIVETGLRILDRDGAAALTMRRVAQDLDTGAASLYVYVANRDDLMAAMLDHVLGSVPEPAGADWRERLTALIDAMVAAMSRHEGLALVALGVIPSSPNAMRLVESMLRSLTEAGLDDRTAAWAVDLLYLHITASAAEQSAHRTGGGSEQEYLATIERRFAELPADRYPTVVAMRAALLAGGGEARAAWAVRVLLNGILATRAE